MGLSLSGLKDRFKSKSPKLEEFFGDYEVPSFPGAITTLLGIIRNEESSTAEIAKGLESDPGMSVRILRLVNSASYGLRHRVEDVSQAVNLIGRSSLETILISLAMKDTLPSKARPGFDPAAFWRVASQRAAIAGHMAAQMSPQDRSFFWTAAMLQDLAIPLLADHLGDRYSKVLVDWHEGLEPLDALEREQFGFDHCELGQQIGQVWELPERLTEAIGTHHAPPTIETAPSQLVAMIRPGGPESGEEPLGVAEVLESATSIGLDVEVCTEQIQLGLAEADDLNAIK